MERAAEPDGGDERLLLLGWLRCHRDALESKCDGLAPADLVRTGLGGSTMSLLGLVRHMTEMERVYLVHGLRGGQLELVYGPYDDGGPEGDFDGLHPGMVQTSFDAWMREREQADRLLGGVESFDAIGGAGRWSVRAHLLKVIQEYARHNGHADLIRQSIDGSTGE
jgi:hypothetical protein